MNVFLAIHSSSCLSLHCLDICKEHTIKVYGHINRTVPHDFWAGCVRDGKYTIKGDYAESNLIGAGDYVL